MKNLMIATLLVVLNSTNVLAQTRGGDYPPEPLPKQPSLPKPGNSKFPAPGSAELQCGDLTISITSGGLLTVKNKIDANVLHTGTFVSSDEGHLDKHFYTLDAYDPGTEKGSLVLVTGSTCPIGSCRALPRKTLNMKLKTGVSEVTAACSIKYLFNVYDYL
ncbi:MAG TPA: hypothetical protein VM432_07925 [Bdellovibrionales bacterium]|nr:hypothetical protein [Bdellovibrionales bacterium]